MPKYQKLKSVTDATEYDDEKKDDIIGAESGVNDDNNGGTPLKSVINKIISPKSGSKAKIDEELKLEKDHEIAKKYLEWVNVTETVIPNLTQFHISSRKDTYIARSDTNDLLRFGLEKRLISNEYNPYVKVSLFESIDSKKTLPIYCGGINVSFRECDTNYFEFDIPDGKVFNECSIVFKVYSDHLWKSADDYIGTGNITLDGLENEDDRICTYYAQISLESIDDSDSKGVFAGYLHIKGKKLSDKKVGIEISALTHARIVTGDGSVFGDKQFWLLLFGFIAYLFIYATIIWLTEITYGGVHNEFDDCLWFALITVYYIFCIFL